LKFSGQVRDTSGKPINGAKILILINGKIKSDRSKTITDQKGVYTIFENSCPCDFNFEIVVLKEGYKQYRRQMPGKEANKLSELNIVLTPEIQSNIS